MAYIKAITLPRMHKAAKELPKPAFDGPETTAHPRRRPLANQSCAHTAYHPLPHWVLAHMHRQ